LTALQAERAELSAQVRALEASLAKANAEVAKAQADLSKSSADAAALQAVQADLEARVKQAMEEARNAKAAVQSRAEVRVYKKAGRGACVPRLLTALA
jgi:hypothetical protein